jgi:predicted nucleic acid-binding protein
MIVVDTNVVAYFYVSVPFSVEAEMALRRDRLWHAPFLLRSELRNVLALHIRQGTMTLEQSERVMRQAEGLMTKFHEVDSSSVLGLAKESGCTAYDCEFVALARDLGTRLVTADRRLATAFPQDACLLTDFAAGS